MSIFISLTISCVVFISNPNISYSELDDEIIYQNALIYFNNQIEKNDENSKKIKIRMFDKINTKKYQLSQNYLSDNLHKASIINKIPISEIEKIIKKSVLKEIFFEDTIFKNVEISDEEIIKEYQRNFLNYFQEEKIFLYHLFSKSEQFLKMVKKESEEKGVVDLNGWETLDWVSKNDLPIFFTPAFKLKDGTFSDVISSEYGYHLFWMDKKKGASLKSIDNAKKEIYLKLVQEKQQEIFDKWLEKQRKECKIITPKTIF